jgi:hypothetical protein
MLLFKATAVYDMVSSVQLLIWVYDDLEVIWLRAERMHQLWLSRPDCPSIKELWRHETI